jgi:hypothetical protein
MRVPRRLCYTLSGLALASVLGCSSGPPAPDALGDLSPSDRPAVVDSAADSDQTVADLPGDVPADNLGDRPVADVPADRPDAPPDMLADIGPEAPQIGYYCIPDGSADMPNCPSGEMFATDPMCPDGCRPVG